MEAALARLDAGAYGLCQDCGAQIPADRLEILPYARCCVPCRASAMPGAGCPNTCACSWPVSCTRR
ncbi:MAG: TraR/DksA C4-type zinc finger protein [Actinomadura rubrobrunea]|nr:TraR/DksA C4-type zinc finger protein [Actinomadura rubrobrunea]